MQRGEEEKNLIEIVRTRQKVRQGEMRLVKQRD